MYNKLKYIKLFEQYNDNVHSNIDPYGEEDWEYDNLSPVLQLARKQNKPYDQIIELDCSYNQLTSLEGIENLVNLEGLYCSDNQLTSLEGIENLINLKELICSNNQLTSLEGIENLIHLKGLYCSDNQLNSLEGIENLINLKKLWCSNNQFSNDYIKYIKEHCERNNIRLNL
jgi:Leucine-rich repeat (LRR) protein